MSVADLLPESSAALAVWLLGAAALGMLAILVFAGVVSWKRCGHRGWIGLLAGAAAYAFK